MRSIVGNVAVRDVASTVDGLRAQLERMQGRRLETPVLPVPQALATLLPGGGLRPGASYSLGRSMSLLFALFARPSQDGAEAAREAGVDLSRLVLIPEPGERWLAVTAAIADVLPVVAVRPPARAKDGDIARLAARMREREAVLLVQGPWPQTEAMIDVGDPSWSGIGEGYGLLEGRELTVTVTSRRFPRPRTGRVLLPDAAGAVSRAVTPDHGMPLRAVS